jgi:serine/threonine-protein kinase
MDSGIERFGRYLILKRLRRGSMSEILLATDLEATGSRRVVALKRFFSSTTDNREFHEHYLPELRATSALEHPGICRLYEVAELDGTWYAAMEYISGVDVGTLVRRAVTAAESIPEELVATIGACAADALQHAHERGAIAGHTDVLVHGNVAPENVLISYRGEVKLVDFGVSAARIQTVTTQPGSVKARFSYMAPEQARGAPADPQTDVFALGVVCYELLARRRLFKGETESAVVQLVTEGPIPPLSEAGDRVSEDLDAAIMKALARDRRARYQSAAEFASALRDYAIGAGHVIDGKGAVEETALYVRKRFANEYVKEREESERLQSLARQTGDVPARPPTSPGYMSASSAQGVPPGRTGVSRSTSGGAAIPGGPPGPPAPPPGTGSFPGRSTGTGAHPGAGGMAPLGSGGYPPVPPGSGGYSPPTGGSYPPPGSGAYPLGSGGYPPMGPPPPPPRPSNAGAWIAVVAGVLLVGVLVAAAYFLWPAAEPPAAAGSLEVSVQPASLGPQSHVYLDGALLPGQAPMEIKEIATGPHQVKVRVDDENFAAWKEDVQVMAGQPTRVQAMPKRRSVALTLVVSPTGATVKLTREGGGIVPTQRDKQAEGDDGDAYRAEELEAGLSYDIVASAKGHRTWVGAISLGAAREQEFAVTLEEGEDEPVKPAGGVAAAPVRRQVVVAQPRAQQPAEEPEDDAPQDRFAISRVRGTLEVTSNPAGLSFRVDGLTGTFTTPRNDMQVGTGPRKVFVTGPDGKVHERLAVVFGGRSVRVHVDTEAGAGAGGAPVGAAPGDTRDASATKFKDLPDEPEGGSGGDAPGAPRLSPRSADLLAKVKAAGIKTGTPGGAAEGGGAAGFGFLLVNAIPKAEVHIDDKATGLTTPVRDYRLPVGRHKITLVEPTSGTRRERWVHIRANTTSPLLEKF